MLRRRGWLTEAAGHSISAAVGCGGWPESSDSSPEASSLSKVSELRRRSARLRAQREVQVRAGRSLRADLRWPAGPLLTCALLAGSLLAGSLLAAGSCHCTAKSASARGLLAAALIASRSRGPSSGRLAAQISSPNSSRAISSVSLPSLTRIEARSSSAPRLQRETGETSGRVACSPSACASEEDGLKERRMKIEGLRPILLLLRRPARPVASSGRSARRPGSPAHAGPGRSTRPRGPRLSWCR